eukprot:15246149-Heterocapsa_arctica.AAC.1
MVSVGSGVGTADRPLQAGRSGPQSLLRAAGRRRPHSRPGPLPQLRVAGEAHGHLAAMPRLAHHRG